MTRQRNDRAPAGSERVVSFAEQNKHGIADGSDRAASCMDREAYLFGELDVESSGAFERHQKDCAACQKEVSKHLALSALLTPSQSVFSSVSEAEHQRIVEAVFSSAPKVGHQRNLERVFRAKGAEGIATVTDGLKSSDVAGRDGAGSAGQTKPLWLFSTLHGLFSTLCGFFSTLRGFFSTLRSLFSLRSLAWSALVCVLVGAAVLLGQFETSKQREDSEGRPLSRSLSHRTARRSPDTSHHAARRSPDTSHHAARRSPDTSHHAARRSPDAFHGVARRSPEASSHITPSPRRAVKAQRLVMARSVKPPTRTREPKITANPKNIASMPDVADVWLHQESIRIVAYTSQPKQRDVRTHTQKSGQNPHQQGIEARRQQGINELEAVRVVVVVPKRVGHFTHAEARYRGRLQKEATMSFSDVVVRVVSLDARYGSGEDARYGSREDARHGNAEMEVRVEDDPSAFLAIERGGADAVEAEKGRTAKHQEKIPSALPWVPKVIPRDIAEETKQPVLIL
ncbi:hypothetical protein L6R29_06285 [Myxococcota bacterium]|nr:hypothetical protein [Myxococcota bacterium]